MFRPWWSIRLQWFAAQNRDLLVPSFTWTIPCIRILGTLSNKIVRIQTWSGQNSLTASTFWAGLHSVSPSSHNRLVHTGFSLISKCHLWYVTQQWLPSLLVFLQNVSFYGFPTFSPWQSLQIIVFFFWLLWWTSSLAVRQQGVWFITAHIRVSMFIFSSTSGYCQLCSTSLSKQEKEQIFPLPVAAALVQMSLTVSLNAHMRKILNSPRIIFHFQAAPKESRSKNSLLSAHQRQHITKWWRSERWCLEGAHHSFLILENMVECRFQ